MVSFEIKVDESKLLEVTEALKKYDVKFDKSIIEYLKYDHYYFERKKELEKLLKDIKSGKEKLYDFEEEMDRLKDEFATGGEKKGYKKILQNRGTLAESVDFTIRNNKLILGTNIKYAPIHQFGGVAGKSHTAKIPARPFLPITCPGLAVLISITTVFAFR